jgi:hypothetical protein
MTQPFFGKESLGKERKMPLAFSNEKSGLVYWGPDD